MEHDKDQRSAMKQRIIAAARTDDRIVGLVDYGSGGEGRADDLSDVDVAVFVRDDAYDAFARDWQVWAAQFGSPLLAYRGRYRHPWCVYDTQPVPLRVDFDLHRASHAGRVVDWENSARSVDGMLWYDETGGELHDAVAALVGKSLAPRDLPRAFAADCGDFWYFALFVYCKLRRGEHWIARQVYQSEVVDHLLHLLRLEAGDVALERWEWEKNAYGVERTVAPERLARLDACIAGRGTDDVIRALRSAVDLGADVSAAIAAAYGVAWPETLAHRLRALLGSEAPAAPPAPAGFDEAARAFITSQRVARLATADASGCPHVVPVCFALDGTVLYTPIDEKPKRGDARSLRRLRNIAANPQVQVLFDAYDDTDWSRVRYVQLRGRARIIEAGAEHARAVAALRARYPQYRAMALESRPVIAVDVERVVSWSGG